MSFGNGHPRAGACFDALFGGREREEEADRGERTPVRARRQSEGAYVSDLIRWWHTVPGDELHRIRVDAERRRDFRTALRAFQEQERRRRSALSLITPTAAPIDPKGGGS